MTGPRSRADFNIRFREQVALGPTAPGEVASKANATYTATAKVLIGGAVGTADLHEILTLTPKHGVSTPGWSPLSLHVTAA